MAVNTGKIQGKHREFNLNLNVATMFALALICFDVCRYLPLLGVSSTIENNGSRMHRKRESKRKR